MAVELRYAVLGVLAMTCLLGNSPLAAAAGKTIMAASCSSANVQSAINSAVDGDTVIVPAGSCTWTSAVSINNKGITLQGAGIGQTIITNGSSNIIVHISLQVGAPTLSITGFTFDANLRDTGSEPFMEIIGGGMNAFRLHHFEMINLLERGIIIDLDGNEGSGLIDHCTFGMPVKSGGSKALSLLGVGPEEHQPFSRPLELGSAKFIFIEDCTFNYGGPNDGALDAYSGARYVFRHNIVNNTHVEHHGADSGFSRGVHSFEIYENKFTCTGDCENQRKFYFRSGTGVVFNNTFTGNYSEAELTNYRSDESFDPWGICNGSSPWDENRPGQNGYACLDQIGHVFGPTSGGANKLEPLYEWGNTQNGRADVDFVVSASHAYADKHIVEGRDFYNDMPRPGYIPYPYPHPLTGVSPAPSPAPPGNLRVVP
jgi:hypothetical protein